MRILLINVAHPAIGSRIPKEQLPPLGLLSVGGSLIDAGHEVKLIDGEFGPMKHAATAEQALAWAPDAVLFGHTGSTSGHPIVMEVSCLIRALMPRVLIVYGGVHPTWRFAGGGRRVDGGEDAGGDLVASAAPWRQAKPSKNALTIRLNSSARSK